MRRILVMADTHRDETRLWQAVRRHPEAVMLFHLGDGLREAETVAVAAETPECRFVAGNNDWDSDAPVAGLEVVAGRRIFFTHGHRYNVKFGVDRLLYAAREREADIVMFGHTHAPLTAYEDGLHILNPGSLRYTKTYGVVDFLPSPAGKPAAIVARILHL